MLGSGLGQGARYLRILLVALTLALPGCASNPDAMVQTARAALPGGSDPGAVDRAKLNPDWRYLRVTADGGRVALLVLGFVDPDPQGPIEVWYSAEREVLRLQRGRLVGTTGMLTEWRNVSLSGIPDWAALSGSGAHAKWVRTRDVMPGYRFGVQDSMELAEVPAPAKSALRTLDPKALAWFEERTSALPVARYALQTVNGRPHVVYGEQCLDPATCFTWQRWPAGSLGSE